MSEQPDKGLQDHSDSVSLPQEVEHVAANDAAQVVNEHLPPENGYNISDLVRGPDVDELPPKTALLQYAEY